MSAPAEEKSSFVINGKSWSGAVHPLKRLLDTIREDVGLTGTKEGCGEGECGACTVFLDGQVVMSCMVPTCQAEGKQITTIEGLAENGRLHPMQESFAQEGGAQCGICTPGMIMAAVAYARDPGSAEDMREALAGNLCRCTGYIRIFEAVKKAMAK
ncbi:MAG: hypothetical protein A3G34_01985 [Candidatus Lindowbacteria bacterium RIFCSPLOWO2_12_FULL_62_27]|nr:MAG: hypothetical protein A3I06_11505 [Candidatus Lindowbacteria bacterium RIFCSPLOWO2_02_FULL_62_12]OGH59077.1 MAG: hypothetical protein A3G34_01985 [Candidatus Lindowbacteria bacterium RIFCSPLOWO2_12_FULL_62_27]